MRPISGLNRPALQYLFVALALVLMAVGVWGALSVRRASREIERLHAAELNGRIEREQLEARVAREQSARESLSLQIARAKSGAMPVGKSPDTPTLTLTPLTRRGPAPPPASVAPPHPSQVIALRLVLPRGVDRRGAAYRITIRSWSSGQTIWFRGALGSTEADGRRVVQANISGDVFAEGSYEALLTATMPDGAEKGIASYEVTVGR